MRLIAAGLLASLIFTAPASAQTAPPQVEAQEAKPAKPKRVCRSIELTGQRVPKRVCKTEAEWAGDSVRDGQEALRVRSVGSAGG